MDKNLFQNGSRVAVQFHNGGSMEGTIVDGPVFKDGKVIFKVKHSAFEDWYPAKSIKPFLRQVP